MGKKEGGGKREMGKKRERLCVCVCERERERERERDIESMVAVYRMRPVYVRSFALQP